jgi:hypothetical protein
VRAHVPALAWDAMPVRGRLRFLSARASGKKRLPLALFLKTGHPKPRAQVDG